MSSVSLTHTFVGGDTIQPDEVNTNFTDITDVVNGGLQNDNIASDAAIVQTKLSSVTAYPLTLLASGSLVYRCGTTGDTNPRAAIDSDGHLVLGSGSAAGDVRIKRESAGVAAIRNAADSAYEDLKVDNLITATPLDSNYGGTGLANSDLSGNAGQSLVVNGAGDGWELGSAGGAQVGVFQARLTLETGVAISTSDQTAKTTIYLTKFLGNQIGIWNGSSTTVMTLNSGEVSASLSGLTANLPYDVFCYDSDAGGDVDALELVAWTSTTARATSLDLVADGYYVKNGDTSKRYCGTILITSTTGQCEDSTSFRGVFNAHNRVRRELKAIDGTNSWTYATTSFRSFRNSTTLGQGKVRVMAGLADTAIKLKAALYAENASALVLAYCGIGINSTSSNSAQVSVPGSTQGGLSGAVGSTGHAEYVGFLSARMHDCYPLESISTASSTTFYGDNGGTNMQSGLIGEVLM